MKKKVTYGDLKATFPIEKRSVESIYGRIVPVRQISYWFTIPLLNIGTTAFQASVIGMLIAIVACIFIAMPNNILRIIGVILVPIWHIFDCVDGNIARYNKTASEFGEAVDAICGYFLPIWLSLSLGIASYNIGNNHLNLSPGWFLIFGGIGAIANAQARLVHQKYAFSAAMIEKKTGKYIEKGEHQYTLSGFHKFRKMAMVELGPIGIPMFILWLCPILNLFAELTIYYCLFYSAGLVMVTFKYLKLCNSSCKVNNDE
jgi:phosphatidylglycerophosphate synthase